MLIAIAVMIAILSIEVGDRVVMERLHREQAAEAYYVVQVIKEELSKYPDLNEAPGMTRRSGVVWGRYQWGYDYTYQQKDRSLAVTVWGSSPHRQPPLWIFSIGRKNFGGLGFKYDVYKKYELEADDIRL